MSHRIGFMTASVHSHLLWKPRIRMFRLFGLLLVGLVLAGCMVTIVGDSLDSTKQMYYALINDDDLCRVVAENKSVKIFKKGLPKHPPATTAQNAKQAELRGLNCKKEHKFIEWSNDRIRSRATSKNYDKFSTEWTKHSQSSEFVTEAKTQKL